MSATHLPPQHRGIFVIRRLIHPDGSITRISDGPFAITQLARRNEIVDARLQGFYFPEIRPGLAYEATNFITSQVVSFRNLTASEDATLGNFRYLVRNGKISYAYQQGEAMRRTIFRRCHPANTVAITRNGSAYIMVGLS